MALTCCLAASAYSVRLYINAENFPDANFRAFLLSQPWGTNGYVDDPSTITSMDCSGWNISSLDGLENFFGLVTLDCSDNNLTLLPYNSQEGRFDQSFPSLTTFKCGKNKFETLDLSDSHIRTLDVSENPELKSLSIAAWGLRELNCSNCTQLSDMPMAFSGTANLTSINCSHCAFTSLDFSRLSLLETLDCSSNMLTVLVLSTSSPLSTLDISGNKIAGSRMDVFINSLPTKDAETTFRVKNTDDGNDMTTDQVAATKAKKWVPLEYVDGSWVEMEGRTPVDDENAIYNTLTAYDFYIPSNTISHTGIEGYACLIDGDKTTKWCARCGFSPWRPIWIDFKSDKPFVPTGYVLTTAGDAETYPERNPKAWALYGKANLEDEWTLLSDIPDGAAAGMEAKNTADYAFNIDNEKVVYQYFRFQVNETGTETTSYSNYFVVQLAELQFTGTQPIEDLEVFAGFTATAVHAPNNSISDTGDEGYAKLVDDNNGTKWCYVNSTGNWESISIEFENDEAFIPRRYMFTTANDSKTYPNRNPQKWAIYGKAEPSDEWTLLSEVTDGGAKGLGTANSTEYEFKMTNQEAYKYFKFVVNELCAKESGNNKYVFQLAELRFKGIKVEVPVVEPTLHSGFTTTACVQPHNSYADIGIDGHDCLVDGNRYSMWMVMSDYYVWCTSYVDFESDEPFVPVSYILTTGNDCKSHPERNPKAWALYAKAKADDNWTLLSRVDDGEQAGLGTDTRTDYEFEINNKKAYKYFSFQINNIGVAESGSNSIIMQISELRFMGLPASEGEEPKDNYDINKDSGVDVGDVNVILADILETNGSTKAYDVNGDGAVDVGDVNAVLGRILGGENETFTVGGVSFTMVPVKGGTFRMGATEEQGDDAYPQETPVHEVTLTDFSIGQTEVTEGLWKAVMGSNPSESQRGDDYPVENVSWEECQEFIAKLNEMTGETFRLPYEAEWEYAARGGSKSKGYKYPGGDNLNDLAWYMPNAFIVGESDANYGKHPVSTRPANELGLYDMAGNVNEWCQDVYGNYDSEPQRDPIGFLMPGENHAIRGGGWRTFWKYCRVSARDYESQSTKDNGIGLRLVK